jgi:nucleotide-binding universal stress UspA family protein
MMPTTEQVVSGTGSEASPARNAARSGTPVLVVGYTDDQQGATVLRTVAALAHRVGAEVCVVHGIRLGDYPTDPDSTDWEEKGQHRIEAHRETVRRAMAEEGVRWTYQASRGDPAMALRRSAEEHDALMIVVGSRGEGPGAMAQRILEPSVSHRLIARQARPVLVVPPGGLAGRP